MIKTNTAAAKILNLDLLKAAYRWHRSGYVHLLCPVYDLLYLSVKHKSSEQEWKPGTWEWTQCPILNASRDIQSSTEMLSANTGASGGSVAPAVIPTLSSPVFSNLFVRAVGVGVFLSPAGCQRPRRSTNEPCSELSTLGAEWEPGGGHNAVNY